MNTNLILIRNSPLRTVLVNEDTRQPMYRIETPRKIVRRTTRIRKMRPSDNTIQTLVDPLADDSLDSDDDKTLFESTSRELQVEQRKDEPIIGERTEENVNLDNGEMARIYWKTFSADRIVFAGQIHKRSELLSRTCCLFSSGYKFEVGNVKYQWNLGFLGVSPPKLFVDDGSKTLIAEFHRKRYIINKSKACLEVSPRAMEILDHVVLTFVFVEEKRRERIKRMQRNGGGGP